MTGDSQHAESPPFRPRDLWCQPLRLECTRLSSQRPHSGSGNESVGLVIIGLEAQSHRLAAESEQCVVEVDAGTKLGAGHPGPAQIDARVDLDHRTAAFRE